MVDVKVVIVVAEHLVANKLEKILCCRNVLVFILLNIVALVMFAASIHTLCVCHYLFWL